MRIALVYVPVPRYLLSEAEKRFGNTFFQSYAKTHFKYFSSKALRHLWEVEKVNQGLLYIASYLQENGVEVSYYAYASNPYLPPADGSLMVLNDLSKDLDELDLVCIYSLTCNYHLAESIAFELKAKKPEVIIGLGGPHATASASQILNRRIFTKGLSDYRKCVSPFDFIGIGEGEETVLELVSCLQNKGRIEPVPGSVVKLNGSVITGPTRYRADPVKFPIPAYELANIEQLPAARIFPNRGCPNSCAFCADPWRKRVTYVTLDRISEEIDFLYSHYGTKYLYLGCEDFLYDEKRAVEIAEAIHSTQLDIVWSAQCRAKFSINTKTMDILERCGCVALEFGVESAKQSILDCVNKNIRVEDAQKCFEIAKSYGLYTHAYWMLGLPGETLTTAEQTINVMLQWAEEGLVDTWEYKIYIPYPGTPIYIYHERYGIKILSHNYRDYHYGLDSVISTDGLGPEELKSIYQKGLSLSADLMRSRLGSDEVEIGVDLETIENMF